MHNAQPPARRTVVVDIERERDYWRQHYQDLPRARAMRSFARYWQVLSAAYDVFLNHPRADAEEGLHLFLQREGVRASPLTETEARDVFGRVWSRIQGTPAP
ncbi:hypothetical protein [Pseudoxanthomonas taiwanensis]|uniref:hypothetical protein n=1 Tax=Pseudoxanthomonas taiwanensis TaxID=176598 RepID=UPI001478AD3C|nr:hypothetical protein [Pseudoxanthomonas taiwanensis]